MMNPNYKLSPERILLKNINKTLDEEFFKRWVYEQFEGEIKPKKLKTIKLLKGLRILKDGEQSKGIVFVEFTKPEHALFFIRKLAKHQEACLSELINKRKELPIIEFAFEDVKKLRKLEDVKQKIKKKHKEEQKEEDVVQKKNEKQQFSKLLQENRKKLAKKLVNDAMRYKSDDLAKQAIEALEALRSRGLKQRLYKKLRKKFSHLISDAKASETPKEKKPVKNGDVKRQNKKIKKKAPEKNVELVKTKANVKQKNKDKRKEMDKIVDQLDNYEKKFMKSFKEKTKWSEAQA